MTQRFWGIALLAATVAACGDGGEDGDGTGGSAGSGGTGAVVAPVCDEGFTPCGGSPVGVWNFEQACGEERFVVGLSSTIEVCRDLPSTMRWDRIEGQAVYREDGTLDLRYESARSHVFDVPVPCLEAMEPGYPAEQLCVALGRSVADAQGFTGGCSWRSDDTCGCELGVPGETVRSTHTWSVEGGVLTVDGDARTARPYCANDGYLVEVQGEGDERVVHVLSRADSEAPVCDEGFTPCGGSPVGVWEFGQSCGSEPLEVNLSEQEGPCRGIPSTNRIERMDGRATFREDGTLVLSGEVEAVQTFEVPVACLEAASGGSPLPDVCVGIGMMMDELEFFSGGCDWDGARCDCEVTFSGPESRTIAWETEGTTLRFLEDGVVTESYEYCAGEDYLVRRRAAGDQAVSHVDARGAPTAP